MSPVVSAANKGAFSAALDSTAQLDWDHAITLDRGGNGSVAGDLWTLDVAGLAALGVLAHAAQIDVGTQVGQWKSMSQTYPLDDVLGPITA